MADKKFVANDETRSQARKISSMSATLSKLETKVDGQKQVVSTTNKVLGKLAAAVETATSSIEKVATNAVRYTKDTLDQYSKQIGQDISVNKKNLMALSITQATPVFGYFVSKFFETDIFQKTMQKIKDSFINGLKSVVDKVRGMILGTWGGLKRMVGLKKKEPFNEKIPKMAKGGYISKGGLTRLHAAEVVMPIDKLLDRIDEKIETKSTSNISLAFKKFSDDQKETLNEYIKTSKQGSSKITDSVTKLDQSNRIYNREILESLSDIRVALAGYSKGIREWISSMFQNFLLRHPAIRAVYNISGWFLGKVRGMINFPFTRRGGYKKFLSKDPNAFNGTRDILNTTFVFSMERYDTIIQLLTQQLTATQDMASAFTGKKYKTALHKTYPEYTIAGAFMRLIGRGAKGIGKIAAWEYRGVKKMLGKGGKTGAQTPSQEVSLVNITDKFGLLLDVQMKMLYTLKKCCSNIAKNKENVEEGLSGEKIFQKKLLKGYYVQNKKTQETTTVLKSVKKDLSNVRKNISESPYSQKALKFLKGIKDRVFDLGTTLKNQVKKAGSYIWDAIKWLGGSLVGLLTTAWGMIPDPIKAAIGGGIAAYVGTKIGEKLNEYFPKLIAELKTSVFGVGPETPKKFKMKDREYKEKRQKELKETSFLKRMTMWENYGMAGKLYSNIFGSEFERKYGIPGVKPTMMERATTVIGTQAPKLIGIKSIDAQSRQLAENAQEAVQKAKDKYALNFLKKMKKDMSPDAFYNLSEAYRIAAKETDIDSVFKQFFDSGYMIKDEHNKIMLSSEYLTTHAPLTKKITVKALEKVGLGEQMKDVYIHQLKAEESRDIQNKNFADYIKGEMSSGAYKLLTKSGLDGISDRYSVMLLNHQLIKHKGKIISLYEYLDATTNLSFQNKMKFIFGLRDIPEKDIPKLLGIVPQNLQWNISDVNRAILEHQDPLLLNIFGRENYLKAMSPAQAMAIAQQDEINKSWIENFEQTNKPFTSVLSEFGENFMESFVEHASEIREAYIAPSIENAKIIGLEVKKEVVRNDSIKKTIEGLKKKSKSDEQQQEDVKKALDNFNRIMSHSNINNRNEINNVIKSSLNNNTSVGPSSGNNQSVAPDPNIQSILTGDLR